MDEPTVAVDPQSRNKILEGILEGCRQNGLSENEIQKAVHTTRKEMKKQEKKKESHGREVGR
jgi:energy-coupling factor transporter ATP-binding protein EcfA2